MKPYKTYCGNHLYYISNNEVRCLYCDYTKDISKEPNPFKPFDSTALYEEDLKKATKENGYTNVNNYFKNKL